VSGREHPPAVPPDRPADRIQLRGLRATGVHGLLPEERTRAQPFELDLDLAVDLAPAGASDRLEDTVDYGAIAERAVRVVTESAPRDLLETLAETVAGTVLAADRRIEAVTVTLKKLRPPLAVDVSTVGVTISRVR
jgi:dihydroneopterin aldolase